jgi:CheY-like chemotaxis protein
LHNVEKLSEYMTMMVIERELPCLATPALPARGTGNMEGGEARMAHVVLTEPYEPMARVLRLLLERAGHIVAHCAEPTALLALLESSSIPLVVVLTSHLLPIDTAHRSSSPESHQADTCRHVLEHVLGTSADPLAHRRHTAVVLTALADLLPSSLRHRLNEAGVSVLSKPFDANALIGAVDHAATRLRPHS